MAHFITLPVNENGVITDTYFAQEIATVCSPDFGMTDVVLYSHGWWTDADAAMSLYNRFSTGFSSNLIKLANAGVPLPGIPGAAFGIGLHWPSMLSENSTGVLDQAELLSYYTMEQRADTVGQNALYTVLRKAIELNADRPKPLKFHLLGHSFGCKVVCSALQQIALEYTAEQVQKALDLNVVLIQAAFKNDELEKGGDYEDLVEPVLDLRLLVTTSQFDKALGIQFPLAQTVNIFATNTDHVAMGSGGPTPATAELFGGCDKLVINPGYSATDFTSKSRLVCADISALHDRDNKEGLYVPDSFGGNHSDINIPELYTLIAAFLFG